MGFPALKRMLFISGLPRSGSTLLSAILRQNPAIHAGISSPLVNMVTVMQRALSGAQEFSYEVDNPTRERVLRGLFETYYANRPERLIADTNRVWTTKLAVLCDLFPDARIVCCVRPVLDILESFERIFRDNRLETSAMLGFDSELNIYGRVDRLMVPSGVVGVALNSLKDAFFGPLSDRLLLVGYDRLVAQPGSVMDAIYDFVGEPRFAHDFENAAFNAAGFDDSHGLRGLHTVRAKVARAPSHTTLPPDLAQMFRGPEFWGTPGQPSRAKTLV